MNKPRQVTLDPGLPRIALSFSVGGLLSQACASIMLQPNNTLLVNVWMIVPDRDTGRPTVVEHYYRHPTLDPATALRAALLQFVTHEVDESILVDGVRPFDPHTFEPHPASDAT